MPCTDHRGDSNYEASRLRERLDQVARIACAALNELEDNNIAEALLLRNSEVRDWWIEHKKFDEKEGRR